MLVEECAEFILNMRTAAGLTTKELAQRLDVPVAALKGFERGENLPPNPDKFVRRLREIVKNEIRESRAGSDGNNNTRNMVFAHV